MSKDPPVSARTLRRAEIRLGHAVLGAIARLELQITSFRSEVGERLRMIELELEALGTVVPTLPRWTKEQREAFEAGDTDRKIGNGVKALVELENLMYQV